MALPKFSGRPKKPKRLIVRQVQGQSMLPALREGGLALAWAMPHRLSCGDIVIFRHEATDYIKRISDIKDDTFFAVGDNPEFSTDSRDFGWLERSCILGRVWWPRRPRPTASSNAPRTNGQEGIVIK